MTPQHFEQAMEYHRAAQMGVWEALTSARCRMDCEKYCALQQQLARHNAEIVKLLELRNSDKIAGAEIDVRGYWVKV